jgi:hypothetical protein
MDPVAERAASYMLRATQLLELAATLRDEQSKQLLVVTATYYERLALALLRELRSAN